MIYYLLYIGDFSPSTVSGRAIANILELFGIFGLAFPVGVIGNELDRAYTKNYYRLMERSEILERALVEEMDKMHQESQPPAGVLSSVAADEEKVIEDIDCLHVKNNGSLKNSCVLSNQPLLDESTSQKSGLVDIKRQLESSSKQASEKRIKIPKKKFQLLRKDSSVVFFPVRSISGRQLDSETWHASNENEISLDPLPIATDQNTINELIKETQGNMKSVTKIKSKVNEQILNLQEEFEELNVLYIKLSTRLGKLECMNTPNTLRRSPSFPNLA